MKLPGAAISYIAVEGISRITYWNIRFLQLITSLIVRENREDSRRHELC